MTEKTDNEQKLEMAMKQLLKQQNQVGNASAKKWINFISVAIFVALGVTFGVIVLSMNMPVFSMAGNLGADSEVYSMKTDLSGEGMGSISSTLDNASRKLARGLAPAAHAAEPTDTPTQMRVYKAQMLLQLDLITDELDQIKKTARDFKGYIVDSTMQVSGSRQWITVKLRVPADRYEQALAAFASMGKVLTRNEEISDVTMEYIDVGARLKNLKREEGSIANLLNQQGELLDVLKIEKELARIRTEIESLEGRRRFLKDQAAFSTINLKIIEEEPVIVTVVDAWPLGATWRAAKASFIRVASAITSALIYAFVFSPYGLGLYVIYRVGKFWWIRKASRVD